MARSFGEKGVGFLRAFDVSFGDDLHQRHPGPVQVHKRVVAGVGILARVLLQMRPVDADTLAAAVGQFDVQPAVAALGQLVLGNLIAFGQVRVVVVLAGKDGGF